MAAKSKAKVWPQECHQWDFSNLTAHKNTQMGRWIWIITWEWDRLPNSESRPRWLVTVVGKPPPAGHQLVNPNAPHFHLWIYIIIFPCCTFFCIMYTLCIVFYLHILYISLSYPAPTERERERYTEWEGERFSILAGTVRPFHTQVFLGSGKRKRGKKHTSNCKVAGK